MDEFEARERSQIFFRFTDAGQMYFFSCTLISYDPETRAAAFGIPSQLHVSERRFERRERLSESSRVRFVNPDKQEFSARVVDRSESGLAAEIYDAPQLGEGSYLEVEGERGRRQFAQVRNQANGRNGWKRLGVSLSSVPSTAPLEIDIRTKVAPVGLARRAVALTRETTRRSWKRLMLSPVRPSYTSKYESFIDSDGREISAIIDSVGNPVGAPVVVIPPAWGKTKETLLPLAATIVATFERLGRPINVVRFDGVNRKGGSHKDPGCSEPGMEHLRFSFSQAARDIEEVASCLSASNYESTQFVLVTFSAASVEGRRAMARDDRGRFQGWVSVVGMPDLQFAMRETSGGIDYAAGCANGIRFGLQEVLGVLVDMDHCGTDAIDARLAFMEDARVDMAAIQAPVTWIHGEHDAWMDRARVEELMRAGSASARRLVQVPTGHQLRSSVEALDTFQLVASEVAYLLCGVRATPQLPDLYELESRRRDEIATAKIGATSVERLDDFWRDYLLGRDRRLGMQLLTASGPYRRLMDLQCDLLHPTADQRILDLGSGAGSFADSLARRNSLNGVRLVELDLVGDAIRRSSAHGNAGMSGVVADVRQSNALPFSAESFDSVLASLFLNYVPIEEALSEIHRVLRPGGELVLSCLRPDADIAPVFKQSVAELDESAAIAQFGEHGRGHLDSARSLLNDAAKLVQFEEAGIFRFYSKGDLLEHLKSFGFEVKTVRRSLGDPPQAIVVLARREV